MIDLIEAAEEESRVTSNVIDIEVLPPENATSHITDEDSGDEDGGGVMNNLPGSMLRAEAVVFDSEGEYEEDVQTNTLPL